MRKKWRKKFLHHSTRKRWKEVTVFPVKPWTPEKISGMFIVSRPIRCEMKPQKITDEPQQGSVTTWYEATKWPFLLREIFNFPFVSLWNSYFLPQSNTSHLIPGIRSKTKLPNWPNSECKLWKFTTVHVRAISQLQKIRIENHQSQPTSMTFWLARETNTEEHCLWLFHFFSLSDTLSSCVWLTDPVFLI